MEWIGVSKSRRLILEESVHAVHIPLAPAEVFIQRNTLNWSNYHRFHAVGSTQSPHYNNLASMISPTRQIKSKGTVPNTQGAGSWPRRLSDAADTFPCASAPNGQRSVSTLFKQSVNSELHHFIILRVFIQS